jgi:hypothetical protein
MSGIAPPSTRAATTRHRRRETLSFHPETHQQQHAMNQSKVTVEAEIDSRRVMLMMNLYYSDW